MLGRSSTTKVFQTKSRAREEKEKGGEGAVRGVGVKMPQFCNKWRGGGSVELGAAATSLGSEETLRVPFKVLSLHPLGSKLHHDF